jgi:serine/threonine-protein kinase
MPLLPGSRIGSYEIVAPLGAGGMGEVYRARDSRLKRDVAIKVLPADVATDRERLARFQREAEVLASLNHPHIAHVYGIEESSGTSALVMEVVEGEDLAQRIERGPIPLDEALPIAKQIAEALEAAHDAGIVHRDLKPANIKVRADGTVKVLDFGLAKALEPGAALARHSLGEGGSREPGADLANSPTIASPAMTERGLILGTAAYMSPEQARGRPVDRRADLWAFGCVLYELLTGRKAFAGDDLTDTLTAIMRDEPDWDALPRETPESVRRLLRRCVRKDVRERLRDAGDARLELDPGDRTPVGEPPPRTSPARMAMVGGAGLVLGALVTALSVGTWSRTPRAPASITRLSLAPSVAAPFAADAEDASTIAITPDGRRVFYTARRLDPDGARIAARQLLSRELGSFEDTPIPNAGMSPRAMFTSPDNAWVGFETTTGARVVAVLAKAPAAGGPMTVLCELGPRGELRGASWGRDGRIVFATAQTGTGLHVISDAGGTPTVLTTPDDGNGERNHRWPEILPDGAGLLFAISRADRSVDIAVLPGGSRTWQVLIRDAGAPRYLSPGYIVYVSRGVAYAVRFDLRSVSVQGEPVPVLDGVLTKESGVAEFAVADNGTLAFLPGGARQALHRLVWLERDGSTAALPLEPRGYTDARLSPDGRRVAVTIAERDTVGIWTYDLVQDTFTRLLPREERVDSPVWSPDSRRIAFWSGTDPGIYTVAVDGSDRSTRLATAESGRLYPNAWASDGRSIAFIRERPQLTLQAVATTAPHDVRPMGPGSGADVEASYSPDGRWIAHAAFTGKVPEIVVGPADNAERRWPVADRGRHPAWSADGRELLFYEAAAIQAVPIDPATGRATGRARKIVDVPPQLSVDTVEQTSNGERFLVRERVDDEASRTEIRIVLNWLEELRTKLTSPSQ